MYVLYEAYTMCRCMLCPECKIGVTGRSYEGNVATTVSGRTCQAWSSHYPHQHVYNLDSMYPDGSVAAAGNKCRNPAYDYFDGVWCFTTDPNLRWELCDVPFCYGKCILQPISRDTLE